MLAAVFLDRFEQAGGKAVAARPGGDEVGCELRAVGLGLVEAGRQLELGAGRDRTVQAADPEQALGHQQDALPVALHLVARLGMEPAEAVAVDDRGVRGIAQVVEIETVEFRDVFDRNGGRGCGLGGVHIALHGPLREGLQPLRM